MPETFAHRLRRNPYSEGYEPRRIDVGTESGKVVTRGLDSYPRFFADAVLVTSDNSANVSLAAWKTFYETHFDGTLFLFKARFPAFHIVEGEALGTSAGGAGESFALDLKYIDSSTLVVYVNSVDQAGDWSLSGNNSAPQVDTGAGFDAGTVTADYEYYYPVQFVGTPGPTLLRHGTTLADPGVDEIRVSVRETQPGAHRA